VASPYVFIGGVDVSFACLRALCEAGRPPRLALGYDESRAQASGYADLAPLCEEHGVELLRVRDVNADDVRARLEAAEPEVGLVVGWSQLLKRPLLTLPRHGMVGIHPTPLPKGRGRAPIPWTILKGLPRTASTMFFLTEGVDDGDIVGAVPVEVEEREDAGSLYAKHRQAHVELVTTHIDQLLAGSVPRAPQDDASATYWPGRKPEDGRIDPTRPAAEVDRLVRAVTHPFPGAFLEREGERVILWRTEPAEGPPDAAPGEIVSRDDGDFLSCGDGALRILEADGL
jgi:methionyl-tRNA formyltransferase